MKYAKHGYTALAAAVALAFGVANAQDGIDRESGLDSPPGIASPDEHAGQDQQHSAQGQQHDVQGLEHSAEARGEQAADEFESALDGNESERESAAGIDIDGSADQSESERVAAGGDAGQLDQLTEEHENLGKFVEAVKAAGLAESLTGGTSYTVFAPTDDALDSMPDDWLEPENREQLVSMLRAHIVADDVDQEMAKTLQTAQTIDGGSVDIAAEEDELKVGDAKVVEPDIQIGSLRVHVIDDVLSEGERVASAESGVDEQGVELEGDEEVEIASGEDDSVLREDDSVLR